MPMLFSSEISKQLDAINKADNCINDVEKEFVIQKCLRSQIGELLCKFESSFPESIDELLLCGPNIGISNPFLRHPKEYVIRKKHLM